MAITGIISKYPSTLIYQLKSVEKMPLEIFETAEFGSKYVAQSIAWAIKRKEQLGQTTVLGLATGSSPIKIYGELVRMHKEEGLSFKNVVTFNLDEYYGLTHDDPQSYHYFMHEHLFQYIDIPKENIYIPDGTIPMDQVSKYCDHYEKQIQLHGGLDIQILGIGRTGHIGFNEPGSDQKSITRLIQLDNITRRDAAESFGNIEDVPYKAITMGIKTILSAKEIYIMAWGQHKAEIVRSSVEEEPTPRIPATFLQLHSNVRYCIDGAAAEKLTRVETPWRVGSCQWTDNLTCKAVVWLSQLTGKPILKLTDEDYNEHGLSELIAERDNAYQINLAIFNRLQHTITGWPGGKPNTDDRNRPERSTPTKKSVIIFSPHPDDDVISMGGTFLRLVDQDHDVHVAYQTSGNIAVHNHDAQRFLEFYEQYNKLASITPKNPLFDAALKTLLSDAKDKNTPEVRAVKGLIRRGEATAAARFSGLKDKNIHFLDLPFYEASKVKKSNGTEADVAIIKELLMARKPHQVFAAGDLADPHGTDRICLDAILTAFEELKDEKWIKNCWLWLYRGAWHEYTIDEIEMTIPLSPQELLKKRKAIYMHQSQKDSAPFPGEDSREFWQRAEHRNKATAEMYRDLGFAEYEAMEAFKRWKFSFQQ